MKKLLAFLLLLTSLPAIASQVSVSEPKWWVKDGVTLVSFDLSGKVRYSLFTLQNPDRLVVDFRDGRYSGTASRNIGNHPMIRKVRSGARDNGIWRVVLDLKQAISPESYLTADSKRLIIKLLPPGTRHKPVAPKPAAAPILASNKPAPAPAPQHTAPIQRTPPKPSGRVGSRDVVVVIDPGHGGYDVGAQGLGGTQEKDVVMNISRELAARINREEGMRAILTRNGDQFIKLRERMQIARDANADLFISVHANGYKNELARGASVFILSPRGASSEAARLLAERENNAESIGTIELADMDAELQAVLVDLSQSATIRESHDVAKRVLKQLSPVGRIHMRQVQKAGFAVLKSPDVPSILIETAFITNREEERKLGSSAHQREIADAILGGVRDYFYSNPPPDTLIALRQRNKQRLADAKRSLSVPES